MNRPLKHLHFAVLVAALLCCPGFAAGAQRDESAQAKAKLAAVRARITALTTRLGSQLQQRDAMNARVRAAEMLITDKRTRVDALRAAEAACAARWHRMRNACARSARSWPRR
jgi:chromosome segregation ATPase